MQSTESTGHKDTVPEGTECGPGLARRAMKAIGFTLLGVAVAVPAICLYLGRRALTRTRPSQSRAPRDATAGPKPTEPIRITVVAAEPQHVEVETAENAAVEASPVRMTSVEPEPPYVASTESDKFHVPSCRWARQIQEEHRLTFAHREDAISEGYVPCGTCSP